MNNYEYTSPDINEEGKALLEEYSRILSALERGEYPQSHCYFVIYTEDRPKGYWGTDKLVELLEGYRHDLEYEGVRFYIATLWNENPGVAPLVMDIDDEETIPEETLKIVRNGTLLNLSDFVYGCCLSETLVPDYLAEIVAVLLQPIDGIEGISEDQCYLIFSALESIARKLAESKPTIAH